LIIYLLALFKICFNPGKFFYSWSSLLKLFLLIFLIFLHYYYSGYLFSLAQDSFKFFSSLIVITFFAPASYIVANSLINISQITFQNIIKLIFFILIVNAIMSLTGIDFFSIGSNKPSFLFSEPAHFAIISAPFLIYYIKSRLAWWKTALSIFILFAIYIENLTMLLVVIATIFISFNVKNILLIFLLLLIIFLNFANVDYFSSRLLFSEDSLNNISLLVLIQGWQNAFLAFSNTLGWGMGFQQFGIAGSSSDLTERLIELGGSNLNLFDGGSTAAKLFGEFGLFGAILVLVIISRAIKAYFSLISAKSMSDLSIFSRCVEITILVELFVRGIGYFSPGIFLYLIIIYCHKLTKKNEKLCNVK